MSVNNIDKILQYVGPFSKNPITVDGVNYDKFNIQKSSIKLSPSFFWIDNCESCGRCCCITENVVLTQFEYENLMNYTDKDFDEYGLDVNDLHKLREDIVPEVHDINGKTVTIYKHKERKQHMHVDSKGKDVDCCYHLFKAPDELYKCRIHPVRSITCRMPHLRVFYNTKHGSASIGISQFGRNWALGCPVRFAECTTEEQFNTIKESRINLLKYLLTVATDINCDTYLPELIEYIGYITFENHKQMVNKDVISIMNTHHKKIV